MTGAVDKSEVEFKFVNEVTRIHEDPRVTLPYSDDQWAAVMALGERVDAELTANDVRLTMGGEPTFVSIDDMDGEEWNTAADGVAKRRLADDLARRLRDRFGQGGVLQFGQGKWYPGEALPRWQIGVVWRRDGEPLWTDPTLLADPSAPGSATVQDAEALIGALAGRFGLMKQ